MAGAEIQTTPTTDFRHGHTTVTTTESAVFPSTEYLARSVKIRALTANTANIYIGRTGVATSGASGGDELAPGESVVYDYNPQAEPLFALSASGTQHLCWVAIA